MTRGIFVIGMLLPMALMAQEPKNVELKQELNQEINNMYPEFKVKVHAAKKHTTYVASNATVAAAPAADDSDGLPATVQAEPQIQPLAIIEDTPAKESKADQLRKRRNAIETETEEKIVEHLENERVKSEQRRARKIVGNLHEDDGAETVAPSELQPIQVNETARIQTVTPVQAPSATVSTDTVVLSKDSIGEEDATKTQGFVGAVAGLGSYPSAQNIKGTYAAGFQAGASLSDGLVLEGMALFSNYNYNSQLYYSGQGINLQVDQLNISGAVKYQLMTSRVRPVVGALASYTRRSYTNQYGYGGYGYGYGYSSGSATPVMVTQGLDVGLIAGVDIQVSKSFSVGGDFRYLFGLSSSANSTLNSQIANSNLTTYAMDVLPEKLNYYTVMFGGKFTF